MIAGSFDMEVNVEVVEISSTAGLSVESFFDYVVSEVQKRKNIYQQVACLLKTIAVQIKQENKCAIM